MSAIPSELCKPAPRRVHWEPLAWLVGFGLAAFLCFPLALIFSSWRDVHIDEILTARGEIAKGGVRRTHQGLDCAYFQGPYRLQVSYRL
jgi:hypothetical protein